MRILMISPHPTFSPRGTPISVLNRCRALCALGHEVDLVTYGIGTDVPVPGLRWFRAPVPGIRSVKVGPSVSKFPLDLAVFVKAFLRGWAGRDSYDVVHTHEEAGVVGALLARLLRLPHVYDMGNDLSVVMRNYGFAPRHPLTRIAVGVETLTVRWSTSVIAHFPSIAGRVAGIADGRVLATVAENVPIEAPADPELAGRMRAEWSRDGRPIALYTGTLEGYQGIPALIDAMRLVRDHGSPLTLVIVGGSADQQRALTAHVAAAGLAEQVHIAGAVQQEMIRSCLAAADILVSPRARGSNTPLKIFSYMHAGKPVVATRIPGHLQVLDDLSATLVAPTPDGLAAGLLAVQADPEEAARRAERARQLAGERYGLKAYVRAVSRAYEAVGGALTSDELVVTATRRISAELTRSAA